MPVEIGSNATGRTVSFQKRINSTGDSNTKNITAEYGVLRQRTRELTGDIEESHASALHHQIESGQTAWLAQGPLPMLEALSDFGFSWRQVAYLAGVSVPAVQKWRRGEGMSPEKRSALARVLSFLDMLEKQLLVNEVASWCSTRVVAASRITHLDLIAKDRLELAWDRAGNHASGTDVLDRYDPDWRAAIVDDGFEVFEAEDGQLALRPRE